MCSSRDNNTHSWVRISRGSNKFVMNLNNDTEIHEDQFEEQALQLDAKDFVRPIKGKSKTTKKKTCWLFTKNRSHWKKELDRYWTREIFPFRLWGIEESNFFFFVIHNKCIKKKTERFISGERRKIFRFHSHHLFIGLTNDGKHVLQQEEQYCIGDSGTIVFTELFKSIQDAILLSLHWRTMLLFRVSYRSDLLSRMRWFLCQTVLKHVLLMKAIRSTLKMKYFVRERKDRLLIMTWVMSQ